MPRRSLRSLGVVLAAMLSMAGIVFVAATSAGAAELLDRVMAVANGDVILLSDVRAAQRFLLVDAPAAAAGDVATVAKLIDRALMLDEVDRYAPPEPQAEAIRAALQAVRARFASPEAFATALREVGSSEPLLSEQLRQNLRIRAYLDQRFTADTPAHSDEAIAEWLAGLRRRASIVDRTAAK